MTEAIRVLVAPDAFKSSITAADAARHLAAGLSSDPRCRAVECPIADGGEGTLAVLARLGGRVHEATVTGPLGDPVQASWAALGDSAYVEVAQGAGAQHVPIRSPETCLRASSIGVGQLIAAALDDGYRRIILTTGGSAVSDGGTGMLAALGARFWPPDSGSSGGGSLGKVHKVEFAALDPRLRETEFLVAVDVANPLLGPEGAARVFASQKGAGPSEIGLLEAGLAHWAAQLEGGLRWAHEPGSGASGGIGFAAMAALAARRFSGAELVLDLLEIGDLLTDVDLVVTGEGSFDRQTLAGKAPLALAHRARARGIPVVAVAGRVELGEDTLEEHGILASWSLVQLAGSQESAMAGAGAWLQEAGRLVSAQLPKLIDRSR